GDAAVWVGRECELGVVVEAAQDELDRRRGAKQQEPAGAEPHSAALGGLGGQHAGGDAVAVGGQRRVAGEGVPVVGAPYDVGHGVDVEGAQAVALDVLAGDGGDGGLDGGPQLGGERVEVLALGDGLGAVEHPEGDLEVVRDLG